MYKKLAALALLSAIMMADAGAWGFWAHRKINNLAVYTLPPAMIRFYKKHQAYLTEAAPNPDKRRSQDPAEGPRHYIDLDAKLYGDSALRTLPHRWQAAIARYTEDSIKKYGTVPYQITLVCANLTEAMRARDYNRILILSADLGHYAADANVPLHTTINYDGQLSNQKGIHALWESRLPERYDGDYDFFVGKAAYVESIPDRAFATVAEANHALDSVLTFERNLSRQFSDDQKYAIVQRGKKTERGYQPAFTKAYHVALAGQVERRMQASIKLVGDLWYTCWMDAGQPNLDSDEVGPNPEAYIVYPAKEPKADGPAPRPED